MSRSATLLLGLALLFLAAAALGAIIAFWPTDSASLRGRVTVLFGSRAIPRETDLLVLTILFGALGGFLHVARSFATFAGNRALIASWMWWYCLQPLVAMALAVVLYAVVRGGFFSAGASAADVNPYGLAATSGLAGMFSKQTTDKLNELFSAMFRSGADESRADKA